MIVRVGDVPVEELPRVRRRIGQGNPTSRWRSTFERPAQEATDEARETAADARRPKTELLTFEVPAQPLRDFGLVMKMGPIAAVQDGFAGREGGLEGGRS